MMAVGIGNGIMSKEEIITAVALTADKDTLDRLSDVLKHRDEIGAGQKEPETRLITMSEAAKRLGVCRTTVWRLIKDGSLQAMSVRGKNRVKLSSVMKYVGL